MDRITIKNDKGEILAVLYIDVHAKEVRVKETNGVSVTID